MTEIQILEQGFPTENQEIAGDIRILGQVFQAEIQILIVISSPDKRYIFIEYKRTNIYFKNIKFQRPDMHGKLEPTIPTCSIRPQFDLLTTKHTCTVLLRNY